MAIVEADLRKWVKKVWGKPNELKWTEASRGSSIGLPDVTLPLDEYDLPIELKRAQWRKDRSGVTFKIRPSQIRYHAMELGRGRKTALLLAVPFLTDPEFFAVYAIPGAAIPIGGKLSLIELNKCPCIGSSMTVGNLALSVMKGVLVDTLSSKSEFWK